jgi:2-haloacid dehalogenase
MSRRDFLKLTAGSLLLTAACRPTARPAASATPIRAVAFDLFTLFDPRTVTRLAEEIVPGRAAALCEAWRQRQFQYSWIQTAAGRYVDFRAVTDHALTYAAAAERITLSRSARETLLTAYERLEPWPDTRPSLEALRAAGLTLAPLANYTPRMIEGLLGHAGLRGYFQEILSTDRAKTFKPDPRAYALGPKVLGLPREAIAFSAFGGWDAAGARWYGFPTFWVNRLGVPEEVLPPGPHATGPTLTELAAWVEAWGT